MERRLPHPLPGMHDLLKDEYLGLRQAQENLQASLSLHGYQVVDTPVLEPTEIFLRKSGGELASRMYTFVEPGGHRVSLRPEFTSAVICLFIRQEGREPLPLRWQYAGPVFRYAPSDPLGRRQFTQVGAELIGASGPYADAEVMALACRVLTSPARGPSTDGLRLVVGDVGAIHGLLRQFDLSERAILFLLSSLGTLKEGLEGVKRVQEQSQWLGLVQASEQPTAGDTVGSEDARRLVHHLMASTLEHQVGVRTPEEIVDRLLQKLQGGDAREQFERGLEFAAAVSQLQGQPAPTLDAARRLAKQYHLDSSPVDSLEKTLQVLGSHSLEGMEVSLDLGLARGIAYYTGIVFEIHHGAALGEQSLGGGGRYDGLIKALGSDEDVAALGFAYTLERVAAIRAPQGSAQVPGQLPKRVLVVPRHQRLYQQALQVADALRLEGEAAEVALTDGPLEVHKEHAQRKGMDAIIVVEDDGTSQRHRV